MSEAVYPTDWTTKEAFMRSHGVQSAKWDAEDHLLECTLGPAPIPAEDETSTKPSTISPTEQERRAREERRRLATASSGGPVRRLDERD